jgi:hypothetical protein
MPRSDQFSLMFGQESLNSPELCAGKTSIAFQSNGLKLKLGRFIVALNVHVWKLVTISRIKEKAVWAGPQCGWHRLVP